MWLELCLHSIDYYIIVVRAALVWGPSTNWLDDCDDALRSFNGTVIIFFYLGYQVFCIRAEVIFILYIFFFTSLGTFLSHIFIHTYAMRNHYLKSH